jgi:hypothetical protein
MKFFSPTSATNRHSETLVTALEPQDRLTYLGPLGHSERQATQKQSLRVG